MAGTKNSTLLHLYGLYRGKVATTRKMLAPRANVKLPVAKLKNLDLSDERANFTADKRPAADPPIKITTRQEQQGA